MATSGISSSTYNRLSGLASGLDTEQIISGLMKLERAPLDKLYQKKQLSEWKMDDYRTITSQIKALQDTYFNVAKPSSNLLSKSAYLKFSTASTDNTVVTATGTTGAAAGSHTITVSTLATGATNTSSAGVTKQVQTSGAADFAAAAGKSFDITIDGTKKTITVGADAGSPAANINALQSAINNAFGSNKVAITDAGSGKLKFDVNSASGIKKMELSAGSPDALASLGFGAGDSLVYNKLSLSDTLQSAASKMGTAFTDNGSGKVSITVNNKTFNFDWASTSISSMMSTINSDATANATIQYDELTDKFKIASKQTGVASTLQFSETGSTFLAAAGLNQASNVAGTDASFTLDTQMLTRSTNSFSINGISYNLLKTSGTQQTITVNQDADGVFNNIKGFVEAYNGLLEGINKKLEEKYDRNYLPLTDEQKEAMNEDDVKRWETKAKAGLLRNDPMLQDMLGSMRRALSDKVGGLSTTLASIGISTGSYQDKGKLLIDETKLKDAIKNTPDAVANLFTTQSSITTNMNLTGTQQVQRYNEEGLAYRLSDIIDKNIRVFRDDNGKKGLLLEKAGILGDTTATSNIISKEISGFQTKIDDLTVKLIDKEASYYRKYAALEQAMSKMNSQGNWLSSQLGM